MHSHRSLTYRALTAPCCPGLVFLKPLYGPVQHVKSLDSVSTMSCIQGPSKQQTSLDDGSDWQARTSLPRSGESPSAITHSFFVVLLSSSGSAVSDASSNTTSNLLSVTSALTLF